MSKNKKRNRISVITEETPYIAAYVSLSEQLLALREFQKTLPKVIKLLEHINSLKFFKKFAEDKDFRNEFENMVKLVNKLDQYQKSRKVKAFLGFSVKPESQTWDWVKWCLPKYYPKIVGNMSLVYLVAEFESFLKKILTISFEKRPETLMTCQKSITYEDLIRLGTPDAIRERIIEKETSIVNDDIEEINKYFKQRFNVDLSNIVNWRKFRERFYRRNVIVHNSGMPNQLYRLKTGYKGKQKPLAVSENYLDKSLKLFDKMAYKIALSFHNKFEASKE